jgi:hypothetical protein
MSEQYPGGFITKTNPTVDGSTAKGLWTLSQAAGYAKQGLWPTVPAAPTIGTATAGNASASVAFTAPANIGSSAITSYTATSSPGAFTGTGASSPVTVSGLTNGTAYTFTVQATNGAGTGPASAASNSVTPVVPNYIEEMFSTYLYTGTGAALTVTNNINLSANGGMVWVKRRNTTGSNRLYDTARDDVLSSNSTAAQGNAGSTYFAGVSSSGFTLGTNTDVNASSSTYASWTFRKQPKFFDIVTWTGNGNSNRLITHALGSIPAVIMIKATSTTGSWYVSVRNSGLNGDTNDFTNTGLGLESTSIRDSSFLGTSQATAWTDTQFTLYSTGARTNVSSVTYVAYLFAHNAGGFGPTGSDNVISCGAYTGTGVSGLNVTLGYEPQWVLIKRASGATAPWYLIDSLRKATYSGAAVLQPNLSDAEVAENAVMVPNATGFSINDTSAIVNASASTYIYVAVRRGPMKVPTLGTTVFGISARTGTGANATVTGGSGVDDAVFVKNRGAAVADLLSSRLTNTEYLVTSTTAAGVAAGVTILQASPWDVMDGVKVGTTSTITNASANTFINYLFSRAPGFFDEICYAGTSTATAYSHNLNAVPELVIIKNRTGVTNWKVWQKDLPANKGLNLNTVSFIESQSWLTTLPTSTTVTIGVAGIETNTSGYTYVAYLFATLAGVSKVGSYTGTAALQTVACGFAAGARFVMIKRTDVDGDWYYWDSVRGLSSGNDPYLLLNTAAAEVTGTNYVDTDTTGFKVTAAAPAALNAVGGTYIFLAIA